MCMCLHTYVCTYLVLTVLRDGAGVISTLQSAISPTSHASVSVLVSQALPTVDRLFEQQAYVLVLQVPVLGPVAHPL